MKMKDSKRALRRHHRSRLKVKREFHWGYGHKQRWNGHSPDAGKIDFMSPRVAGIVVQTPKPCSCWMCGNPRRKAVKDKLTIQEHKADDAFEDSLEEALTNEPV